MRADFNLTNGNRANLNVGVVILSPGKTKTVPLDMTPDLLATLNRQNVTVSYTDSQGNTYVNQDIPLQGSGKSGMGQRPGTHRLGHRDEHAKFSTFLQNDHFRPLTGAEIRNGVDLKVAQPPKPEEDPQVMGMPKELFDDMISKIDGLPEGDVKKTQNIEPMKTVETDTVVTGVKFTERGIHQHQHTEETLEETVPDDISAVLDQVEADLEFDFNGQTVTLTDSDDEALEQAIANLDAAAELLEQAIVLDEADTSDEDGNPSREEELEALHGQKVKSIARSLGLDDKKPKAELISDIIKKEQEDANLQNR